MEREGKRNKKVEREMFDEREREEKNWLYNLFGHERERKEATGRHHHIQREGKKRESHFHPD